MRVSYDESAWPVVVTQFRTGFDADDVQAHVRHVRRYVERGERFGMVYLPTPSRIVSAHERHIMADYIRDNESVLRTVVAGVAVVARSPLERGALTAMSWLVTLPFPAKALETEEAAVRWIRGLL